MISRATSSEKNTANATTRPNCLKYCPAMPPMKLTGENTAISRSYLTDVWPGTSNGIITHPNHPDNPVILYAVYENDYRKIDGIVAGIMSLAGMITRPEETSMYEHTGLGYV